MPGPRKKIYVHAEGARNLDHAPRDFAARRPFCKLCKAVRTCLWIQDEIIRLLLSTTSNFWIVSLKNELLVVRSRSMDTKLNLKGDVCYC